MKKYIFFLNYFCKQYDSALGMFFPIISHHLAARLCLFQRRQMRAGPAALCSHRAAAVYVTVSDLATVSLKDHAKETSLAQQMFTELHILNRSGEEQRKHATVLYK